MFDCQNCKTLREEMKANLHRLDHLVDTATSERQLLNQSAERERIAFAVERAEWSKERASLLARIQAWSPDEKPSKKEESQELQEHEAPDPELEKLRAENFDVTLDGTVIDLNNGTPWESVEEAKQWREYCKRNGLPESTDPRKHFSGQS